MAAVSLSPTPAPIAAMSSRRVPLTSNPNVANSPLRGHSALAGYAKQKRSYANLQREEMYGQPPPIKKQALENGQRAVRSPAKAGSTTTSTSRSNPLFQRAVPRPTLKERVPRPATQSAPRPHDDTDKEVWKKHYGAKFPKMVFYFESIPDDVRAKLTKRVTYLGARQEPFFSIEVTHVVTTRSIPAEKADGEREDSTEQEQEQQPEEQPQTINPSLLDRNARRKLLFDFRQAPVPSQQADDPTRRTKGARNNDVLCKARDMGKKIWSLEKFQNMLSVLLEADTQATGYASRTTSARNHYGASKTAHEPNLLQLLHNERINGPSDRDPTAVNRELAYFKGPFIYVWDMDEKHKPVMVREYPRVPCKADGEWPQFRSVGNGRCPFVEEIELPNREHRDRERERERQRERQREREREREREQARIRSAKDETVTILKPPEIPRPPPAITGKRTLAEMEDGNNLQRIPNGGTIVGAPKAFMPKQVAEMRSQQAFISRTEDGGKLFGGEPVASGMQPSNVTSAIRSQMISSTSGINGSKAGTSKEIHGLQRKVLQKTNPTSHDASSRRLADISVDVASSRSTNMGRPTSRAVHADEDRDGREKKAQLKSKRELKPGYCENCQDKFRDFDEHILSRKHRKFAENNENWAELDSLLEQLKRMPKYSDGESDDDGW